MKTTYKNLLSTALGALVCVALALPASAQRPSTGGGGGGSSHSSGGGGGGGGRPSGGSVGVSRPSGGGVSRPSGGASFGTPRTIQSGQQRPGVGVSQRGNYGYAPRPGVSVNRGNYGYAPRPGVSVAGGGRPALVPRGGTYGGGNYRTAPAIGYGRGGYWGNHGYYHYYHGYYNSYYLPRLGFSIGVLPYGYYPFFYGDYQFYYSDGLFYQYDNNQYTVVEPPIGAEVTNLPDKAQSIVINGQQYYELNGVYYQPVTKDDGTIVYQIAGKDGELNTGGAVQDDQPQGPQMGDIVAQLPQDCRKIKVNGEKLYVSPDGVYYQEQVDANGNKTYKIVGLPSEEPEQNQQ
ncbi:DUF6515 family protein [Mucilaginibacter sp.]|uniref:DUF6515 family protein n=1 Tax=Mucilaginibacter sp. TaxID=1882438 RepID=UPI003D147BFD